MARLFTGKAVSMELLREMETSPVSPPTDWACVSRLCSLAQLTKDLF
jgi:hypothetical protein